MARRESKLIPLPFRDFTGGEASIFPATAMPSKYSTLLQNAFISEHGSIEKIPGYVKVNTTPVAETLTSGFEFRKSDGTVITLGAGGGKIYKSTGATLTSIKTGLDTTAKVFFSQINDLVIMSNGVNPMMKYDGTTVTNLGGTPPATGYKTSVHKGRVWVIERTNKMLASHSALNAPEDYTTAGNAGYIDFRFVLNKGDELVDIVTYVDLHVFVFRDHIAIYSGSNPTATGDYKLVQLIEGTGAVSSDVTLGLGTDLALLYQSGMKSLRQVVTTGSLNTNDLSKLIDPTLRIELKTASIFSTAHYPKLGWVLLLINDKVWIYSYTWKAWYRMVGADVKGMFGTTDGKVYLCGTGYLYQYDSGWDFAGVNPQWMWKTAWLALSKSGLLIYPKLLQLVSQSGVANTIGLSVSYDLNVPMIENLIDFSTEPDIVNYIDSVIDWDNLNPLDEAAYKEIRFPLYGGGRAMQLTFSNTSNQHVDINDLILYVEQGGIR